MESAIFNREPRRFHSRITRCVTNIELSEFVVDMYFFSRAFQMNGKLAEPKRKHKFTNEKITQRAIGEKIGIVL